LYRSGRNEAWLKIKCGQRAKFPIVGFVQDHAGVATRHTAKRERKDIV
jgi:ATP-dependent DNA ligase